MPWTIAAGTTKQPAHFEKALDVQRDHYEVLVNMGITRYHQDRLPEAIEYYHTAIYSQPDAPEAHSQLGLALWKQNRDEAAYDESAPCVTVGTKRRKHS